MISKLSNREKRMVGLAGLALLIFIFIQLILLPTINMQKKLGKSVKRKKSQLVEMQAMHQKYSKFSQNNSSISRLLEKRKPGFSLFSFLEQSANASHVKDNLAYMKPADIKDNESLKQSMVEMKLQAISLQQLVDFLQRIESPENIVGIKRISVQENSKTEGTLDTLLQIVCVDELKEP